MWKNQVVEVTYGTCQME